MPRRHAVRRYEGRIYDERSIYQHAESFNRQPRRPRVGNVRRNIQAFHITRRSYCVQKATKQNVRNGKRKIGWLITGMGRVRKGCCSCSIILSGHSQRSGATWAHAANKRDVQRPGPGRRNQSFIHSRNRSFRHCKNSLDQLNHGHADGYRSRSSHPPRTWCRVV